VARWEHTWRCRAFATLRIERWNSTWILIEACLKNWLSIAMLAEINRTHSQVTRREEFVIKILTRPATHYGCENCRDTKKNSGGLGAWDLRGPMLTIQFFKNESGCITALEQYTELVQLTTANEGLNCRPRTSLHQPYNEPLQKNRRLLFSASKPSHITGTRWHQKMWRVQAIVWGK